MPISKHASERKETARAEAFETCPLCQARFEKMRRWSRSDKGKSRKEVKPEDTTREANALESAGKGTVQGAVPSSPNQLMLF
jgi:hypothetical protein